MSAQPPNQKPENDSQRIEQLKKRRASYKTTEFREAITDAFHKAKLHALDDQAAADDKVISTKAAR